jgi:Flp pilus assembly protein TadD
MIRDFRGDGSGVASFPARAIVGAMKDATLSLLLAACFAGAPGHARAGNPAEDVRVALAAAQAGDLDAADRAIQSALAADPFDDAAVGLRNLVADRREGGVSDAAFERVLAGVAFGYASDLPAARAAYEEALLLQPEYSRALYHLGVILFNEGDNAGAIASFERALAARPDDPSAEDVLGVALLRAERTREALPHALAAVWLAPDDPRAYNNLGATLGRLDQPEEARAAYAKALELKPRYALAQAGILHASAGSSPSDGGAGESPVRALLAAVVAGPPDARTRAVESLAGGNAAVVGPAALPLLRHRRAVVRVAAVSLFKKMPYGGAVDGLIERLTHDPSWAVRVESAAALDVARDPRAQEPLLKALDGDKAPQVRTQAARALVRYPGCATVRALARAQRDPILDVSRQAGRSIARLAGSCAIAAVTSR